MSACIVDPVLTPAVHSGIVLYEYHPPLPPEPTFIVQVPAAVLNTHPTQPPPPPPEPESPLTAQTAFLSPPPPPPAP